MAEVSLIFQATKNIQHATQVNSLFELPGLSDSIISVAFARVAGVKAIEAAIAAHSKHTVVFVGIRNDITSVQAIRRLLDLKVKLYAVDTGSRQVIFHPKLYLTASRQKATLIVGSANLTFGGLHNNIELSSRINLDLGDAKDKIFVDDVLNSFKELIKKYPLHVTLIDTEAKVDALVESGRLADENFIVSPVVSEHVRKGERDELLPMSLFKMPRPPKVAAIAKVAATVKGIKAPKLNKANFYLVWESKELSERDLNIPTGDNTNPTGSMGLKKGAYVDIDHRDYFREQVFKDLTWVLGGTRERATAKFLVVIKNLNYGYFNLEISHNPSKTSASYKQNNMMTHLHWGDVKPLVGKKDLLGRVFRLSRKDTDPPEFMIEID